MLDRRDYVGEMYLEHAIMLPLDANFHQVMAGAPAGDVWLARHPSGFDVWDGEGIPYSPERIIESTLGFSDDEFVAYVESIIDWQLCSTAVLMWGGDVHQAMRDLAVTSPESVLCLGAHPAVDEGDLDLLAWIAWSQA